VNKPRIIRRSHTHKSATTHAGNVFVTRYLDSKINDFPGLIVEYFYAKFGAENRQTATAVGGVISLSLSSLNRRQINTVTAYGPRRFKNPRGAKQSPSSTLASYSVVCQLRFIV